MGRKRKSRLDLPQRVYCHSGAYYYFPFGGSRVPLGRDHAQALVKHADIVSLPGTMKTLGEVMDAYIAERLPSKAESTRKGYLSAVEKRRGLRYTFGHMGPADVEPLHIYRYMGLHKPAQANRDVSTLSAIYSFAIRKGAAVVNPCRDVERNRERPRDRLPERHEIEAFKALCSPQLRLYIDLKVAIGLRRSDMLKLSRSMIREDGLRVKQGKTQRALLFRFVDDGGNSTGLRELLDDVLQLPRKVGSLYLFCRRDGKPYSPGAFTEGWRRLMGKYAKARGEPFHEHDLRATSGTEMEEARGMGEARKLLGHTMEATTRRYTGRRKVEQVTPLKGRK